nr:hypothetical protein [Tanacetum cinerariifolium]
MAWMGRNADIKDASFIIHSASASRYDASTNFTAEADPGISVFNNFIPQQQGNEASDIAKKIKEEFQNEIKLEDLSRLVQDVGVDFMDLYSQEDDLVIVVDERLINQVLILESQKQKLELKKNKVEAEAVFLTALPSYLNVAHLTELLVKSLQPELSKFLSTHDFSSSLPTELKGLPSKFKDLTKEVKRLKKHVHELETELSRDLKDIPNKLEIFTSIIESLTNKVVGLKNLQANKRLKLSIYYKDHPVGTMLNEPGLHQGHRLDDHARTLSSIWLAEIDKRNPLKHMRTIE